MHTGNVERVMISGVHIDDMVLLVAKVDDNNGIDIRFRVLQMILISLSNFRIAWPKWIKLMSLSRN
ncbi:hypothetical protein A3844_08275 [Paenibacillus helianthi]|uniref:Uncharacterized protein n=2 Tax=Paenibacillus helianthi TaxID=1349432 RepID=A0ABX3EUM8_9BACL|nr:hypothetical protein A3848_23795 [Paenibacillus sp. P32E]OKP88359.1 hypothetical protein A3844_08275 [Paenibacillus helianthi]